MLAALGLQFLDAKGNLLPLGGLSLKELTFIDSSYFDPAIKECHFEVACDVDTVLIGGQGASAIFGPQKGATAEMVSQLDNALAHYAKIVAQTLECDVQAIQNHAGSGAAGGMGFAALTFLQGRLSPGITLILDLINFAALIADADLVITGEGKIDRQTLHGKAPIGVARIAKAHNIPAIAIAGSLGDGAHLVKEAGVDALVSILNSPCTLEDAYLESRKNLEQTAENVAAILKVGKML